MFTRYVLFFALVVAAASAAAPDDEWVEAASPKEAPELGQVGGGTRGEDEDGDDGDDWDGDDDTAAEGGESETGGGTAETGGGTAETAPAGAASAASSNDPSCNIKGEPTWCQSPEADYPQQCSEDAGPVWSDDGATFPNKHYWSGSPAEPVLPSSGKCPPPLAASCARKGVKAAHLDGPIKCGGKGFFCRIVPQKGWLNTHPSPMSGDPPGPPGAGVFREANFYHCNKTTKPDEDMPEASDGHCHGGIADDVYGWFVRDHWFRGYAGTLHCCCNYGATKGVVNSCDVRRPVTKEESKKGCNDPNEDARAKYMHKGGCSAEQRAKYTDPLYSTAAGQETCWSIKSFSDPAQVFGYKGKELLEIEPMEDEWSEQDPK